MKYQMPENLLLHLTTEEKRALPNSGKCLQETVVVFTTATSYLYQVKNKTNINTKWKEAD